MTILDGESRQNDWTFLAPGEVCWVPAVGGGQPPSPSHLPFLESQAVPFPVGDFLLLLLTDE